MASEALLGDLQILLGMPFFQMALLGGCLATFVCAIMGLFIVLRKESMIGDSAAHTSFGGVAIGLLLGLDPILFALVLSTLAILGMSYMKKKGIAQSDAAMAVMLATGFAIGLIAIGISGGFNVSVMDYLFGSILTISSADLTLMALLSVAVISVVMLFFKELVAMTFDEPSSRMNGIPVSGLSVTFNILMAVTVVLSIKVVGIILVVALLVIPALAALQLNLSFRRTLMASIVIGVGSTLLGIMLSGLIDLPAAGVIVLADVCVLLTLVTYQRLGRPSHAGPGQGKKARTG